MPTAFEPFGKLLDARRVFVPIQRFVIGGGAGVEAAQFVGVRHPQQIFPRQAVQSVGLRLAVEAQRAARRERRQRG